MNQPNYRQLVDSIVKVAKTTYDNELFFTETLLVKAKKLTERFPTDSTCVSLYNFLSKRASSKLTINRAELRSVYDNCYSKNNNFVKSFGNELGITEAPKENIVPKEDKDLLEAAHTKLVDPVLSQQLESTFTKEAIKHFTPETEADAKKVCVRELNSCGLMPKKINTAGIDSNVIICEAVYETPKGHRSVLIPVEIKDSKALLPYRFATKKGYVSLTASNITAFINSTIEQAPSEIQKDLDLSKYIDQSSVDEFSSKLNTNIGAAEFLFGRDSVELGRSLVDQELKTAGYRNAQICVDGVEKDTIKYAVKIADGFGFVVPVKYVDKNLTVPKIIIAGGKPYNFSQKGLSQMLSKAPSNINAVAKTSGLYGLKPDELVEQIRQAMANDNYLKAEDSLTMLKRSDNPGAYQLGLQAYKAGLAGNLTKSASLKDDEICKQAIKTPNSQHLMCPHTGLSVDKIYKDKSGHCRPLHRKDSGMYEPATFVTAKILGVI